MRLRHARKLRGLTQVELAKGSGVKQASISDLERGESKSFRGTTLVSLAQTLRVSPEWLSHGRGQMDRTEDPLSAEAISVARDWEVLAPEVREKLADMIHELALAARSVGVQVQNGERAEITNDKPTDKRRR
jgi:transcriptional regulator with XRE-family HTH domain